VRLRLHPCSDPKFLWLCEHVTCMTRKMQCHSQRNVSHNVVCGATKLTYRTENKDKIHIPRCLFLSTYTVYYKKKSACLFICFSLYIFPRRCIYDLKKNLFLFYFKHYCTRFKIRTSFNKYFYSYINKCWSGKQNIFHSALSIINPLAENVCVFMVRKIIPVDPSSRSSKTYTGLIQRE
jgi:hypothetical protein